MKGIALGIGLLLLFAADRAAGAIIDILPTQRSTSFLPGDFVIPIDRVAGEGALTGFDIYRFFARFGPASRTGSVDGAAGLQAVKATIQVLAPAGDTSANLKFKFFDLDFDGIPDADVTGATIPNATALSNNSSIGTFVRVNPVSGFSLQSVSPGGYLSDPGGEPPFPNPAVTYGSVKAFRVEGFEKNPPDGPGFDPTAKAATGNGALFAVAVVPTGRGIRIFGQLAADKGEVVSFDMPEPGMAALPGAASALLLGRSARPRSIEPARCS